MSQKQKIFAGIAILAVVVGSGFLYSRFSAEAPSNTDALSVQRAVEVAKDRQQQEAAIPATPDAAVDAILEGALLDDKVLEDELSGEKDAITANGEEINNLSQTYDENQL